MSILADRLRAAVAAVVRELLPNLAFMYPRAYRIEAAGEGKFTALPESKEQGLPPIVDAPIVGSIIGGHKGTTLAKGTRVIVVFVEADPARPKLAHIEGENPDEIELEAAQRMALDAPVIELAEGAQPIARMGDLAAGIFAITTGNPRVRA